MFQIASKTIQNAFFVASKNSALPLVPSLLYTKMFKITDNSSIYWIIVWVGLILTKSGRFFETLMRILNKLNTFRNSEILKNVESVNYYHQG